MIYCVVPQELAGELYDKLAKYYEQDLNVEVIVDRRKGERRGGASGGSVSGGGARQVRDRRRARVPGELPSTNAPAA